MVAATDTRAPLGTVLITGFGPFGNNDVNPSGLVAQALDGAIVAGRRVHGVVLPCIFDESGRALKREIRRLCPELVICTGMAAGRPGISLERVAVNMDDASMPDNAGAQPLAQPIVEGGPAVYWSSLPIEDVAAALREAKLPAEVSGLAGTFVCNHIFYVVMHTLTENGTGLGGFIHLPYLPEQAGQAYNAAPSLRLEQMVAGLRLAIGLSL